MYEMVAEENRACLDFVLWVASNWIHGRDAKTRQGMTRQVDIAWSGGFGAPIATHDKDVEG
jgi:hypothetical protein